jgi:hypothetical protein
MYMVGHGISDNQMTIVIGADTGNVIDYQVVFVRFYKRKTFMGSEDVMDEDLCITMRHIELPVCFVSS